MAAWCVLAASSAEAGPATCDIFSRAENTVDELALACRDYPSIACPTDDPSDWSWTTCQPLEFRGCGNGACTPDVIGEIPGTLRISMLASPAGPEAACAGEPNCIDLSLTLELHLDGPSADLALEHTFVERGFISPEYGEQYSDCCCFQQGLRVGGWDPLLGPYCLFDEKRGGPEGPFIRLDGLAVLKDEPELADWQTSLMQFAEDELDLPFGTVIPTTLERDGDPLVIAPSAEGPLDAMPRWAEYPITIRFASASRPVPSQRESLAVSSSVSVDLSGDVAIVGSPSEQDGRGAAWIYRFDGARWLPDATLEGPGGSPGYSFGSSVAIDADVAAVSTYGGVAIHRFDGIHWSLEEWLGTSGWSIVRLSDDVLVIGDPEADRSSDPFENYGAIHVYRFDGSSWAPEATIIDPAGDFNHEFGWAVDVSHGVIVAGSPANRRAFFYRRGAAGWTSEEVEDVFSRGGFGAAVAISDDAAIVGSPPGFFDEGSGEAYLFRFDGAVWDLEEHFVGYEGQAGALVEVSGPVAFMSQPGADIGGSNWGIVDVYRFGGTTWNADSTLSEAVNGFDGARFGSALSASGAHALVSGFGLSGTHASFFHWPTAELRVTGAATGGGITVDVGARSFVIPTLPGASASDVAGGIAAVLDSDPFLSAAGRRASVALESVELWRYDEEELGIATSDSGLTAAVVTNCSDGRDNDHDRTLDYDGGLGACTACGHDPRETGPPLDPKCCGCVATIVENDAFCGQQGWDGLCVLAVGWHCKPDAGCADASDTYERSPLLACDDGIDNDGDDAIDLRDAGCFGSPTATSEESDADGDGVPDWNDNCTEQANPDQRDTNQDGYGNLCDADVDDNGAVGLSDFNVFRLHFGRTSTSGNFDPNVDLTGDGAIGLAEFNLLRGAFGGSPGPSGLACAGSPPCAP
jgi:hypothetical protein